MVTVKVNAFEYGIPCPLGSHGAMARITAIIDVILFNTTTLGFTDLVISQ